MGEPIRVLHILQRMEAAGVQTLLMSIYRKIDRNKVQFDFLVHYKTPQFFDDEVKKLGGKLYRLSFREDYDPIKYIIDLNKFFSEHNEYKIIHGHMHSLGAVYLWAAKKHNIPIRIAHSHTNSTQKDIKQIPKLIMNNLYAKYATHLFSCSEAAGKYMFGNKKFTVINNAIDTSRFSANKEKRAAIRHELGIDDSFVIGCVGRFEIQKNQKFSVDIFEELLKKRPDSVLLFIGSGSMEQEIKELVSAKRLTNKVKFLGNRFDVDALYNAMDVFLFPSLFEGLGIVGVEAQSTGIPTVCTDTLPEEISVSPLIYRVSLSETPEYWAEKIIEADRNLYKHKDMSSYVQAANYDIIDLVKKLERYYLKKYDQAANVCN